MKLQVLCSIFLPVFQLHSGFAAAQDPDDPAAVFAEVVFELQEVVREPGACLTEDRKCTKSRAGLEKLIARVEAADSNALKMKLIAGVFKKSSKLRDTVFDAGWLDRLFQASGFVVLAAQALADADLEALHELSDLYGSDLSRHTKRIQSLVRKKQLAEEKRTDDSFKVAALYLKKISAVHTGAEKLLASIELFIQKSNLEVPPESDFPALLYENTLATPEDLADWVMEGGGQLEFIDSWMEMRDPKKARHHVLWCPLNFPANFVAEWELQNLHPKAGLLICFFAAKGRNREDLFDPSLKSRGGDFDNYIKGDIDNYHISYYANNPGKPDRPHSRLRKNRGFKLLQAGDKGIPAASEEIHTIRLTKDHNRIKMFVDGRKIIDYTDRNSPLNYGKIGFRQMQWSHFRYRNFRVYGTSDWE